MAQRGLTSTSKNIWGFDPRTIGGCALWLDAADSSSVVLSASNVTQWNDKSGFGRNATAFNNPTYSSNGIVLNGTNQFLTCPDANYRPPNIFIVATRNSSATFGTIIRKGYTGFVTFEFGLRTESDTTIRYQVVPTSGSGVGLGATVSSTVGRRLYGLTYDNTLVTGFYNGESVTSGSLVGPTFSATALLSIGVILDDVNQPVDSYFSGSMNEILIYNNALTTTQRQQVEGYLAWKWGLEDNLPSTHPYGVFTPIVSSIQSLNPTSISGCALWIDATDTSRMTLSGSNISQYIDKSTNQIALSNATTAQQPILITDVNGMRNIQFNGGQTLINAAVVASNLTVSNEMTAFFVHRPTNGTNSLFSYLPNTDTFRITFCTPEGGSRYIFDYGNVNTGRLVRTDSNYLSTGRRLDGGYKRGTSQVIKAYGTIVASRTNTETIAGTQTVEFILGRFSNLSGYHYAGTLCELVWYNRGLNDTEISQVEGYLAWKWGLQNSLPTTHPYYVAPNSIMRPFARTLFPVDVPGCEYWFDASDVGSVVTSAGAVTSWNDLSGNGYVLTAGATQPVYNTGTLKGLNTMRFLSTTNALTLASSTNADPSTSDFSFFAVAYLSANSTDQIIAQKGPTGSFPNLQFRFTNANYTMLDYQYTSNSISFTGSTSPSALNLTSTTGLSVNQQLVFSSVGTSGLSTGTIYYITSITPNTSITVSTTFGGANISTITNSSTAFSAVQDWTTTIPATVIPSGWYILSFVGNRSLAGLTNVYVRNNGTQVAQSTFVNVSNSLTNTSVWNIGGNNFVGSIAEVVYFNNVTLSSTQVQQIEGYLGWKWGLRNLLSTPLSIFTPTSISGCALWLDAADASTVTLSPGTSNVTAWLDKSGNGRNGAATGTITYSRTINNNYALSYPGSNNTYIAGSASNTTNTLTAFSVFIINSSSTTWARIVSLSATGLGDNTNSLYTAAIERYGSLENAYNSFRVGNNLSFATATLGVPAIVCSQYNGTNHTLYLNGTASTSVASTGNFGYTLYTLGTNQNQKTVERLNGSIGEVILFNSSLTPSQIQQVEGYLAWKWGLQNSLPSNHPSFTLSSTHPFYNTPTNAITPFNPKSVSGLSVWLDAADTPTITTSGSNVTLWRDKSGNGNDVSQATTANQPTLSSGGIFFSATAYNFLSFSNLALLRNIPYASLFMMYRLVGTTDNLGRMRIFFSDGSSVGNDRLSTYIYSNDTAPNSVTGVLANPADTSSITTVDGTASISTNINTLINAEVNYASGTITDYINGNIYATGTIASPANTANTNSNSIVLGSSTPATPNLLFRPTNIPGCALWLDAADSSSVVLSGSNVTQWRDKSGNGRNATASNNPTYTNNGIVLNGTNQFLTCPADQYTTPNVFIITTPTGNMYGPALLSKNSTLYFGLDSQTEKLRTNLDNGVIFRITLTNIPYINNVLNMYQFTYDNTNVIHYINGSALSPTGSIAGPLATNSNPLIIGAFQSNSSFFPGIIHEIVIYNNALTTTQRQQVEGYLAWKWGLQGNLPTTHPYFTGITQAKNVFLYEMLLYTSVLTKSQRQQIEGYLAYKWGIQNRLTNTVINFNPTNISGLALWLDAADSNTVTLIGGRPNQWRDKSSNGYTCREFLGGSRTWPYSTSNLNGLRTMNPAGTALAVSSFVWRTKFTAFIVGFSPTGQFNLTEEGVYTNNPYSYGSGVQLMRTPAGAVSDSILGNAPVAPSGQWFIFSIGYNNGLNATNYAVNGTTRASTNLATPASDTTKTLTMCFSCEPNFVSVGNVQVAEIIHYNDSITVNQRQQVEGYLAWKWGLQANLPTTHPYYTLPQGHPYSKIRI